MLTSGTKLSKAKRYRKGCICLLAVGVDPKRTPRWRPLGRRCPKGQTCNVTFTVIEAITDVACRSGTMVYVLAPDGRKWHVDSGYFEVQT